MLAQFVLIELSMKMKLNVLSLWPIWIGKIKPCSSYMVFLLSSGGHGGMWDIEETDPWTPHNFDQQSLIVCQHAEIVYHETLSLISP